MYFTPVTIERELNRDPLTQRQFEDAQLSLLGLARDRVIESFLAEELGGLSKEEVIDILRKAKPENFV